VPTLRVDLEYDGSDFSGWAIQPGRRTIEGCLRAALEPLAPDGYDLAVAGRTDSGVHATAQVVSITAATVPSPYRLRRALEGRLPEDISVAGVSGAAEEFNARFSATARRYEYRVLERRRSALRRNRVLFHPEPLDLSALREAARATIGHHDFRAFTPTQTRHVFFARTVTECRWIRRDDELVFVIQADAFLRHMVRAIVGSHLLVGRGSWSLERFAALLGGAPRGAAGRTAPAHPLTLVGVTYDPAGPRADR
jgi:tRNA pseudouridine38-40 synthase